METNNQEILFVYNADATLFAEVVGLAKKVLTPSKQSCALCTITHGTLGEKKEWRKFLDSLPQKKTFLHRDEFQKLYTTYENIELPAIFERKDDQLTMLMSAKEINKQSTITELTTSLSQQLS